MSRVKRPPPRWATELVAELVEMAEPEAPDRAVLARLRRYIADPARVPITGTRGLFRAVPPKDEDHAFLAAGLFAWAKGSCCQEDDVNFGAAFGGGLTRDQKEQREKRFIDLLNTGAEELPDKLRHAVTLIARDHVGLDWVRLILDLRAWSHPDRPVQRNWARGFWATAEPTDATTVAPTT